MEKYSTVKNVKIAGISIVLLHFPFVEALYLSVGSGKWNDITI